MTGLLISFEGVDGCGKSTQLARAAAWLEARGEQVLVVREPGGTPLGERLRELVLDPTTGDIASAAEALIYAASRAELVERVLHPALDAGVIVLADRFVDSSLAYQGAGRGLGIDEVWSANQLALGGLLPDATLLFDVPLDIAMARLAGAHGSGPDRLEQAGDEFFSRVHAGWREVASRFADRITTIDATGDVDATWELVEEALAAMLDTRPAARPAARPVPGAFT